MSGKIEFKTREFLRVRYTVQYTHLLNFRSLYGDHIAPAMKHANKFTIANEGKHEELVKMRFEEEQCSIEVNWNHIQLDCEGKFDQLLSSGSFSKVFFEMIKTLSAEKSFGKIVSTTTVCTFLSETDEANSNQLNAHFYDQHLSPSFAAKMRQIPDLLDIGVIIDTKNESVATKYQCGPFHGKDDIERLQLGLEPKVVQALADKRGMLHNVVEVRSNPEHVTHATFKSAVQTIQTLIEAYEP